ncbi:hypothetical protein ACFVMC_15035 [Nocardia sp. NPDC127579]|uniref:hypothetical protein n=1 Tax=Nocardia sp. NPDC127579 TaxID=3345402 RepID=UPI00362F3014
MKRIAVALIAPLLAVTGCGDPDSSSGSRLEVPKPKCDEKIYTFIDFDAMRVWQESSEMNQQRSGAELRYGCGEWPDNTVRTVADIRAAPTASHEQAPDTEACKSIAAAREKPFAYKSAQAVAGTIAFCVITSERHVVWFRFLETEPSARQPEYPADGYKLLAHRLD